jgi:hypothetical protein
MAPFCRKDLIQPRLNFGDPGKFQFVRVPLSQVGLATAVVGGACLLAWRCAASGTS